MEVSMIFEKRQLIAPMLFLVTLFCFVSAKNATAQANDDVQAKIYFDHAVQRLRAGNHERAIEFIDAAFNLNINDR